MTMVSQPSDRRTVTCRGCGGTTEENPPLGWYSLSVRVPDWMGRNGKPYVYVGVWCSAACLLASGPELVEQEGLAHEVYQPVTPAGGRRH